MNSENYQIKLSYEVNETTLAQDQTDIEDVAEHVQRYVESKLQSDELIETFDTTVQALVYVVSCAVPLIELEAQLILDNVVERYLVESFITDKLCRIPNLDKEYSWEELFENDTEYTVDDILLTYSEIEAS